MNVQQLGRRCALAMGACFAIVAGVHAGPGDWSGQGPFGGIVFGLKADPALATRVYAVTNNGFFRSDDGGASWSAAETGLLDGHPSNGVLAVSGDTSGGLWLFDDAGRLYASADAGANWIATGYVLGAFPFPNQFALADGEGTTKVWLAANTAGLLVSSDSGATFAPAGGGFPAGQTVTFVATDPADPLHVIASTASSCDALSGVCPVYVSSNGGASWAAGAISGATVAAGAAQRLTALSFGPGGTLYGLYGDANYIGGFYLLASSDGGATWNARGEFGNSVAASPADALTVFVDGDKSVNGGVSFTPLATAGRTTNGVFVPGVSSIVLSPNYPATPRIWIGTPYAGVYLSNDNGATWAASDDGIAATEIRSVVVHPNDNTRIFAGFGDSISDPSPAFYRSTSVGTWTVSNSGLNAYQLRTVLIDPTTAGTIGSTVIYAVGSGFDSTPPSSPGRNSGIYKSLDGGLTWTTKNGGIPTVATTGHFAGNLRTIIADPRSCDARGATAPVCSSGPLQTLYATGGGRPNLSGPNTHPWRVLKSTDAGANWADSSAGLPDDNRDVSGCPGDSIDGVTPIVMDPSNSNILYIGTFASAVDAACNSVTPQVLSGVYKSIDGGASWTRFSNGLPTYVGSSAVYDTLSLAIDPASPQTLWVSTISADFNIPGELYKTIDGGANWTLSNAGITGPDVRALLVDPANPGTLYAASGGLGAANPGGVYKSVDGGATWLSISVGLPAFSALALALDPIDPSVLYAGTTGGVYSIVQLPDADADGVPDLVENSGPNGGDANFDDAPDSSEEVVGTTALGLFGGYGWQSGTASTGQAAALARLQQAINAATTAGTQTPDQTAAGIQGGYFTVEVDNPQQNGCTQAVDVAPVNPGPLGIDAVEHYGTYTYPRGLLRFELPQCDAATLTIYFHPQNTTSFGPGWSWRFYGPSTPGDNATMGWHDASSLVTARTTNTWTIQLAKGAFGSYRPAGTGAILFEGGPAYDETVFSDRFE
jgi:hypothetical protein